jgi:transposase InsO family protein
VSVTSSARYPQTQGKIERWHQTLKNRVLLESYFRPGDLERQIEAFIEHYSHPRARSTRPGMADHGRVMRCISFTAQLRRTWSAGP